MKKKLTVLVLTGALACTMALPAMAADVTAVPISAPVSSEALTALPDSVLYYGTVQEIIQGADGSITQLRMTSERYGEYVMNLSAETVWIDSGKQTASDPSTLQVGESLYVFHSTVETSSLPPSLLPLPWSATSPWMPAVPSIMRLRRSHWKMAS